MGHLPHPASALVAQWASHLAHDRRRFVSACGTLTPELPESIREKLSQKK